MRPLPTLLLVLSSSLSSAQSSDPPQHVVEYTVHTGAHSGPERGSELVFETLVEVPNATWSQLRFESAELGAHSELVLTSLANGDQQHLDGQSLATWNLASGLFQGGAVRLQLFAGAMDSGVYAKLTSVLAGEPPLQAGAIDSLCGADNRSPSSDNRVARMNMGGCTAWRIANGALLTAGHCIDTDPDMAGPLLPDGVPDLTGVIQFNVPGSLSDGSTLPALLVDQYPINTGSFVWRFDGSGQGLGKDWGVFRVGPNSETHLLPHEAYGFPFRVGANDPDFNQTVRVTGFGSDSSPLGSTGGGNAQNFTNQTSSGSYVLESSSGNDVWHSYAVDTTGGNSGSPLIEDNTQLTVGIHTNGGCAASGGVNSGTSFGNSALRNAVDGFKGSATKHVDGGHPYATSDVWGGGSLFAPIPTFHEGVDAVATGGLVSVTAGFYGLPGGQPLVIDRAMTIEGPVGSAVIGQ